MKKILVFILLIISFMYINAYYVKAEEYSCWYEDVEVPSSGTSGGYKDIDIELIIDTEEKTIIGADQIWEIFNENEDAYIFDNLISETTYHKEYLEEIMGYCPKEVYGCRGSLYYDNPLLGNYTDEEISKFPDNFKYITLLDDGFVFFINSSLRSELLYGTDDIQNFQGVYYKLEGSYADCAKAKLNEGDSDKPGKEVYYKGCEIYTDTLWPNLVESWEKAKESSNVNDLQEYYKKRDEFKEFCSMIVNNALSYKGEACVRLCLGLADSIDELEGNKIGYYECGISENLQGWIKNILKWGKYLVPIIVIVLGILDFIKAMSADKDDEMKKAQGRFVKRLIAAALIFIIPFIIEFILDKMGFAAHGCGIIDL